MNMIIVDGYYGSGKTTYCKEFCSKNKDYQYLAIDRLCAKFRGDYSSIFKEVINVVLTAAKEDRNLIIDFYFKPVWRTLLHIILNAEYIKYESGNQSVTVEHIMIPTSLEESYHRYKTRYKNAIGGTVTSFEAYKKRCGID